MFFPTLGCYENSLAPYSLQYTVYKTDEINQMLGFNSPQKSGKFIPSSTTWLIQSIRVAAFFSVDFGEIVMKMLSAWRIDDT